MALRGLIVAASALGVSMCATSPKDEAPTDTATGPDGLVLRHAPTDAVEAGALPAPETDEGE